jgi:hypothetical protein
MARYKDPHLNAVYAAFRHQAQRAGISPREFEAIVDFADGVRPGTSPEQLRRDFEDYTSRRGWEPGHVQSMLAAYTGIQVHGPERFMPPADARADQLVIDRATEMLKNSPDRYWRDTALQEQMREALERQQGREADAAAAQPPPAPTQDDINVIGVAEKMMRERPGDYYHSDMPDRYRQAIANTIGEPQGSPSDAPTGQTEIFQP